MRQYLICTNIYIVMEATIRRTGYSTSTTNKIVSYFHKHKLRIPSRPTEMDEEKRVYEDV